MRKIGMSAEDKSSSQTKPEANPRPTGAQDYANCARKRLRSATIFDNESEGSTNGSMSLPLQKPGEHSRAASRLQRRLCRLIAALESEKPQIDVRLTHNTSTMLSVRREPGRYRLRLHHMFAQASAPVLAALGRYVLCPEPEASKTLDAFIARHSVSVPSHAPGRSRRVVSRTRGVFHDLQAVFDEVNAAYFGGSICARITWGRSKRNSRAPKLHKALTMGSYSVEDRLIRIHPTLDRKDVPAYYVAWIVYHEMLHQKHGIPQRHGRRQYHPPAFLAEERLFDDYERALCFERQHSARLLLY